MVGDIFLQFCSISYEDKITSSRKSVLLANCSYFWEDLLHLCSYKMAFENSWYNIYIYTMQCSETRQSTEEHVIWHRQQSLLSFLNLFYPLLCWSFVSAIFVSVSHLCRQPSVLMSAIFVVGHLCWCQPSLLSAIFVDVSHICCRPSLKLLTMKVTVASVVNCR